MIQCVCVICLYTSFSCWYFMYRAYIYHTTQQLGQSYGELSVLLVCMTSALNKRLTVTRNANNTCLLFCTREKELEMQYHILIRQLFRK